MSDQPETVNMSLDDVIKQNRAKVLASNKKTAAKPKAKKVAAKKPVVAKKSAAAAKVIRDHVYRLLLPIGLIGLCVVLCLQDVYIILLIFIKYRREKVLKLKLLPSTILLFKPLLRSRRLLDTPRLLELML